MVICHLSDIPGGSQCHRFGFVGLAYLGESFYQKSLLFLSAESKRCSSSLEIHDNMTTQTISKCDVPQIQPIWKPLHMSV
jgi:hypothetical protein